MKKSKPSITAIKKSGDVPLILGIDPGIARLGYACLEQDGEKVRMIDAGVFITSPQAIEQRLKLIYEQMEALASKYAFSCLAMEKVFFSKNAKTAMIIEAVRGVLMLFGAQHALPVFHYTPLQVKKTLTMYGQASKYEVQLVSESILGHTLPSSDDACDAVAIALCHYLMKAEV